MWVGHGSAPLIQARQLILDRVRQAVQHDGLVEGPGQPAFGAGTVITENVDEQSVVQLGHRLNGIDQPADLVVGVFCKGREYLHLAGRESLLICRQRVPVGDVRWLGRHLGAWRYYTQLDLSRQRLLAVLVPTAVELALVPVEPIRRHVVRCMGGTGGEVDEESLVRRERLLGPHPGREKN